MPIVMDLRVDSDRWTKALDDIEVVCQTALDAGYAPYAETASVDVLLVDDKDLQTLNSQWRGKDKPTDVLSFPAEPNRENFLGDIAIAFGVASRDAGQQEKSLEAHLSHLLIHGLLHLLGHDHIKDSDAEEMEALERDAMARLGFEDPYSQTVM